MHGSQPCAYFSKGWNNKTSQQRGGSWWEQWVRAPWTAEHPELWPAEAPGVACQEMLGWGSEEPAKQCSGLTRWKYCWDTRIPQELVIATLNIQPVGVLFDPFQENWKGWSNIAYFATQFLFVTGVNSLSEHQWVQDWFLGKGWCHASRWPPEIQTWPFLLSIKSKGQGLPKSFYSSLFPMWLWQGTNRGRTLG